MATEEYKQVMQELLGNYIELRKELQNKNVEQINLSYKEYVEFYLKYNEHFDESYDLDEDLYDEEEEDLDE